MSNLVTRILSSIAFVVLIIGPLFISPRLAYLVYALLGAFTLLELFRIVQKTGSYPIFPIGFSIYSILVLEVYNLVFEPFISNYTILLGLFSFSLIGFFVEIFRSNSTPLQSLASTILSPFFVATSFLGIVYFIEVRNDLPTLWLTVSVFALIWINDSAAYLVGRKIGRTKLFERLSPNKTIEGSIAGLVFALIASVLLSHINGMPGAMIMLGFGLVSVVSGSLGDLFESRLKRAAQIKDSGKFLPGHGGFFDRFDAMMLAIPSAILYFETVLPKS